LFLFGEFMNAPVVVYGAGGYTGRLVCEALRNYQIPFIAAGRDAKRIEEAMQRIPGIETAEYKVVQVEHNVDALSALFKGSKVVCNTVGPFELFGETVVEAAAKAGIHYLDTTGEVQYMERVRTKFDKIFQDKNKVVAPCTAYMYGLLEIAAEIVLETPGIDTIEGVCSASGIPTVGSTQTIISSFEYSAGAFYLENRHRVLWPVAKGYEVSLPGQIATQLALPWGGGSLPFYYERDGRVRNCRQLAGFSSRSLMEQVLGLQAMYENDIKPLPLAEQKERLMALAAAMQPSMPPRENPLVHRSTDHVVGRGGNTVASCTIRGLMPYVITGVIQAAVANFLVHGGQRSAGFLSACQAVGHRQLLGQIQNLGLVDVVTSPPERAIHAHH
jgi:hypothetical protein